MKTVAIHQPQYLPYPGFFHKIAHCDVFVALDHVQFQKNGLQNRNKIKSSAKDGTQWITVPVRHNLSQAINEVRMDSSSPWQKKHWSSLVSNYSRARCFRQYADGLQQALLRDHENLSQLNMHLTAFCMEALDIHTPVLYSSQLNVEGQASALLVDICRATGADAYLSGPGGANYMEMPLFDQAGVKVIWQDFTHPVYEQQFPEKGFIPNLSIVDALLNCGAETAAMVKA